jgi:hemoglobin-like flavoprotein
MWTLEQGLGDDFTPATRQAWGEAYAILAGTMQQAAATP